jgi:hypothetical protein
MVVNGFAVCCSRFTVVRQGSYISHISPIDPISRSPFPVITNRERRTVNRELSRRSLARSSRTEIEL